MEPRKAASVILLRDDEVYLVRRHARSSFMRLAFVFPGGGVDPRDDTPELTAIRELFEETGILLCREEPSADRLQQIRERQAAEQASWDDLLRQEGIHPDPSKLRFWARWVTPSVEPIRFDAVFFIARLPAGRVPSVDGREVIDDRWISPREALAAHEAGEIQLPPPQLRMLFELGAAQARGPAAWESIIADRYDTEARVMPRFALLGDHRQPALLLPWDPGYATQGTGEAYALQQNHPWAWGPGRFLRGADAWHLRSAPAEHL